MCGIRGSALSPPQALVLHTLSDSFPLSLEYHGHELEYQDHELEYQDHQKSDTPDSKGPDLGKT